MDAQLPFSHEVGAELNAKPLADLCENVCQVSLWPDHVDYRRARLGFDYRRARLGFENEANDPERSALRKTEYFRAHPFLASRLKPPADRAREGSSIWHEVGVDLSCRGGLSSPVLPLPRCASESVANHDSIYGAKPYRSQTASSSAAHFL